MSRFLPIVLILMTSISHAGTVPSRHGWSVTDTKLSFQTLVEGLEAAVKAEKMGLVTAASASEAAKLPASPYQGTGLSAYTETILRAEC